MGKLFNHIVNQTYENLKKILPEISIVKSEVIENKSSKILELFYKDALSL